MYIGDINSRKVGSSKGKPLKTVVKQPFTNNWIIYGKYEGVNWETGEIEFYGNDGEKYSNPSNVIAIKNVYDKQYLDDATLDNLRNKKRDIVIANLKSLCEKNKSIKLMVLPIQNDYYGLTEDIEAIMKKDACYDLISNEIGLEYLHNNKIDLNNVNDFLVKKVGANTGVDIIIHGYASEYNVPYRYSSVSSDQSVQRVSNYRYDSEEWITDLMITINNWAVTKTELKLREYASKSSGTYITITYYSIDIKSGEKKFLNKNQTVMKKG